MELLSPAGDRASLVAAVQNGADAVYLGTPLFNARRGASNFAGDELREAVEYCHLRGVRVHITLNTTVRQDEIEALKAAIGEIYISGADAFIIQDPGVALLVRQIAPEMELHASTQMAVHNFQGVMRIKQMGFARAVLAREMTFEEMKSCAGHGVALEAFAHGALCVSCSGQCLMSSMIGARSGNRGMCAQPCRMKYTMGKKEGYLLSTRDLMTVDMLDDFRKAGIDSLKIEGRLKRPEYVAVVTRIYRRALDGYKISDDDIEKLRQIFNRGGFTHGYAGGLDDSAIMFRNRPNNLGVPVGRALKGGIISLNAAVEQADALTLRRADEDIPVKLSGSAGESVKCPAAEKGDVLVRLVSEAQLKSARASWQAENRPRRAAARLSLKVGAPIKLEVSSGDEAVAEYGPTVERAAKYPPDRARIEAQLKKTGGTVFEFDEVAIDADEDAFAPVAQLNALRRAALDKLASDICRVRRVPKTAKPISVSPAAAGKPRLRAQSGSISALMSAAESGADDLVFAPEDMRALDAALALKAFYLALPQVMRAEELDKIHAWASAHAEKIKGVYISNISHAALAWPGDAIADYPMNIANNAAICALGFKEFSPSVELTSRQIDALNGQKDIVVHGYLPLMQLRHCPYRATNDIPGKHSACRLCDGANSLPYIEDRTGARFALRRIAYDSGCVVQLINSVCLMLIRRYKRLPAAYAWRMLIDDQSADAVALYRAALDGNDPTALPQWMKYDKMRTTTGHYFRGVD